MSKFSEPATGKCPTCGDQLLSIPGRQPDQPRRVICPICIASELESMREQFLAGVAAYDKCVESMRQKSPFPSVAREDTVAK